MIDIIFLLAASALADTAWLETVSTAIIYLA